LLEPVFVNVEGAQELIPRNQFLQAENRFLGSLNDLQTQAQFYQWRDKVSPTDVLRTDVSSTNVSLTDVSPNDVFVRRFSSE
jgi:hypothetical protein